MTMIVHAIMKVDYETMQHNIIPTCYLTLKKTVEGLVLEYNMHHAQIGSCFIMNLRALDWTL